MMDDKEEWKAFERRVAELLAAQGYDVYKARLIENIKVDLYAERRRFSKKWRVAVECKDRSRPLTQTQISDIHSRYHTLYDANRVDEILIVTRCGLVEGAETMINSSRILAHQTLDGLLREVIDFTGYIKAMRAQYEEGGLDRYYIDILYEGAPTRNLSRQRPEYSTTPGWSLLGWYGERETLEERVLRWIKDKYAERPIAILGSYGLGKTTFARRLAYILSHEKARAETQRVPILIRLGDIATEQPLEGILGQALAAPDAAYARLHNYDFSTFMQLNQAGYFVVILDGFDEMKHSMTWEVFRRNLSQLNRLVTVRSKVVLLGRPTAFLGEDEYQYALHGIKAVHDHELREIGWPDYEEVGLRFFDRHQVQQFLALYLRYLWEKSEAQNPLRRRIESLERRDLSSVSSKAFSDIARRPVQLRMIAEVLPQWERNIEELTVSELYSVFIDQVIEREVDKKARGPITLRSRREFAADLAWHLWVERRRRSIQPREIPDDIVAKHCADVSDDLDAVRRELVTACFLSRKQGGALYFPHRSFQEFLVAERLIDGISRQEVTLAELMGHASPEVLEFMKGSLGSLATWEPALRAHEGPLSLSVARIWTDVSPKYVMNSFRNGVEAWHLLLFVVLMMSGSDEERLSGAREILSRVPMRQECDRRYHVLSLLCLLVLLAHCARRSVREQISSAILDVLAVVMAEHPELRSSVDVQGLRRGRRAGALCYIGVERLYRQLARMLKGYCIIQEWLSGETLGPRDFALPRKVQTTLDVAEEMGLRMRG